MFRTPLGAAAFISSSKYLMRVTQLLLHCWSAQAVLFLIKELASTCLQQRTRVISSDDILGGRHFCRHSSISCLTDVSYPEDCASGLHECPLRHTSTGFRITRGSQSENNGRGKKCTPILVEFCAVLKMCMRIKAFH